MITFIGSSCWDQTAVIEKTKGDVKNVKERYENIGGNAANAALMANQLGQTTGLITSLGSDQLAIKVMKEFKKTGIKIIYLPAAKTKLANIILHPDGSREILTDAGVSVHSKIKPNMTAIVKDSDIIDFYPGVIRENFSEWYQQAAGKRKAISGIHIKEELKQKRKWEIITESADLIEKPSEEELTKLGVEIFVLTKGSLGGEWWDRESGWHDYPSVKTIANGDSTGAGDAFRAGLLVGLNREMSNQEAVLLASRCGAAAASIKGSLNEDLRRFNKIFK